MKIIIDENIPQARNAFESFGELISLSGREITNEIVHDADVLLVRSITKIDEELLHDSKIKFVATATSGTDHVDIDYLNKNKILFANAAGCNSFSVAEYIITALCKIFNQNYFTFNKKTIGVVGFGNIGSKVVKFCKALGFDVMVNDPPLERKFGPQNFVPLSKILQCNIITFHVPLNLSGNDKTFHLLDEEKLRKIKSGTILINTSRGEVVDNLKLRMRVENNNDLFTVLDVWENEPAIDFELLKKINIGTAHIAGYSLEGKVNGTEIIYKKLCKFLKVTTTWKPVYPSILNPIITLNQKNNFEFLLDEITRQIYDIEYDDKMLREGIGLDKQLQPKHFDTLRKNYRIHREFSNYTIRLNFSDEETKRKLKALRFKVI